MTDILKKFDFEELNSMTNLFQSKVLSQNFEPYNLLKIQSKSYNVNDPSYTYSSFIMNSKESFNIIDLLNKEEAQRLYNTLESLHEECEEEGYEVFDEIARTNAKKVLDFLCKSFPEYDYDIYPTDGREINIEFYSFKGRILILCDSKGSVAYFKSLTGKINRYRCQDIDDFPFDQLYQEFQSFKSHKKETFLSSDNPNIKSSDYEMLNNEDRCA